MSLRFWVDPEEIANQFGAIKQQVIEAVQNGVKALAVTTHQYVLDQSGKLRTSSRKYREAVGWEEIKGQNTYIISLDQSMLWREDGMGPHSMLDTHLKKNFKISKDGCVLNPRNKVLTTEGYKKIKDIVPGDMVLTHSGKFREVKKLLIQPAGIGTEYVRISTKIDNSQPINLSERNMLTAPTMSLTTNHLVLTPNGWVEAGKLKKGDLIAAPSDLQKKCKKCGAPLPINSKVYDFCLNNRCFRSWQTKNSDHGLMRISPEKRKLMNINMTRTNKESGLYDQPDWGARDPETMDRLMKQSIQKRTDNSSTGNWKPEDFFAKKLRENEIEFERQVRIILDITRKGRWGEERPALGYFDFYLPDLKLAIKLDGKYWHSLPSAIIKDAAKDRAAKRDGIALWRFASRKIFDEWEKPINDILLWKKNHSGDLGIVWLPITRVIRGVVDRVDHVYSKKYDICLDADEHSFCCENVFIHNSKYKVIPFEHGGGPTMNSDKTMGFLQILRSALKDRGLSIEKNRKGIETDIRGNPKMGVLHRFNTPGKPQDFASPKPSAVAKFDIFSGLQISQKMGEKAGQTVKNITTFRVMKESHKGEGLWEHPGVKALNLFEKATVWAEVEWEQTLLPDILKNL